MSYIIIFIIALAGIFPAKPQEEEAVAGNVVALCSGVSYSAMVTYMHYEGRDQSLSMVKSYTSLERALK